MRKFFPHIDGKRVSASLAASLLLVFGLFTPARSQSIGNYERESGREMLKMIRLDVQKYYYDPNFHGIDVEARFKEADEKIKKATSNGQIFGIIAQALLDFNDSHLFFTPPPRVSKVEYGWQLRAIGDNCYVVAVKPGSDAEAKGLKPGDKVISVDGFEPTRDVLWKMQYYYYALRPKPGMRLVVQSPGGQPRQVDILAKITEGKKQVSFDFTEWAYQDAEAQNEARLNRQRFYETDDLIVWKMPGFNIYDEHKLDPVMDKVKSRKSLILDLRGNGGGYVNMLTHLLGYFFDHDVKIADVKYRKEVKAEIAKTRGGGHFKGPLVVLIDSESGSAAEIFARIIQLEKRGTVIGDRSAGAVMQSVHYPHQVGLENVIPYGVSITNADVIMTDGKSLEHTGVTPDELLLPTAEDLASGRDPVLSRAAAVLGFKLDPEKAGTLFPIEWRK